MNSDANPVATLIWTFALMSLFAVGGANSAIPEMHRVAVDVQHWMNAGNLPTFSRSPSFRRGRTC